jgi:hypothetical protein
VIDLREEQEEKAIDSMRINSEFISNKIDASELPLEKYFKQKISSHGNEIERLFS